MPVLGNNGIVTLSREWPDPVVLDGSRLTGTTDVRIDLAEPAYETGMQVLLVGLRGVPSDVSGDGYPDAPDGLSFYGDGPNAIGRAVAARTIRGSFYSATSSAAMYESAATVGFETSITAYLSRDSLDDVRFYETEVDAINGGSDGLIGLSRVDVGRMMILPAVDDPAYADAAYEALEAADSPAGGEAALEPVPAVIAAAAADAEVRGWKVQCDLNAWVLEMDAGQLDQDAIGQVFGEYARGMLRGAGSFSGEVDHKYEPGQVDGLSLLRLVMLTQHGSKARARFQLIDRRSRPALQQGQLGPVPKKVFYETDILLGKTTVNTKSADIIRVDAQFVATGKITLVVE
jgi:hypothetical protein